MAAFRRWVVTCMVASAMTLVSVVGASAQEAAQVVENMAAQVLAAVKTGASDAEREQQMSQLFRANFDVNAIGQMVLGRHWNSATPEQRDKFMSAFEKAEIRAYSGRFKNYQGQTLKVGKVSPNGASQLVETQLMQPQGGQPIRIVWEIARGKVIDIQVEGVSMGMTRRSDFNAYISRNGLDALIAELQKRGG
ncbi:MAG: ABC transporter substrate-binding protein [Alphaproteobacteria bacterium]|nr:ABC transporter substrate-binding protein [Alphaproteobacteria bacterium]